MTSAARWKSPTFVFSLKNRWFGWIFPAKLWDFIFSHRDFTNEKHGNVSVSKGGIAWLTPLFQWWPFEVWGNEALNRPLNSWQLTRVSQLGWKQNWLDLIQTWSHGALLQSISLDQEVTIIYSEWWFLFLFFAPPCWIHPEIFVPSIQFLWPVACSYIWQMSSIARLLNLWRPDMGHEGSGPRNRGDIFKTYPSRKKQCFGKSYKSKFFFRGSDVLSQW